MNKSWDVDGLGCSNAAITYRSDFEEFDVSELEEIEGCRSDLLRKAYASYWKSGGGPEPRANWSYTDIAADKIYIVLANYHRVLAVYNYVSGQGMRRLLRWPKSLAALPLGKRTF